MGGWERSRWFPLFIKLLMEIKYYHHTFLWLADESGDKNLQKFQLLNWTISWDIAYVYFLEYILQTIALPF